MRPFGCRARFMRQQYDADRRRNRLWFELRWTQAEVQAPTFRFLTAVAAVHQIASFTMQSESDD